MTIGSSVVWFTAVVAIALATEPSGSDVAIVVHEHGPVCGDSLVTRVTRTLPEGVTIAQGVEIDATWGRRADGQWSIEVEIGRGDSVEPRTLVADDCETALDAAAFVIVVAAGRDVSSVPVEPDAAPTPEPEPVPEPSPIPLPEVETTTRSSTSTATMPRDTMRASSVTTNPSRRPSVGGFVGVAAGVDVGALPRATGWFAGHAGIVGKHWRAGVQGGGRLTTQTVADLDPQAGGRFSLWTVGAHGCGVPTRGVIEVPLCAGLEAGVLRTRGFGFDGARTLRRPWIAALVGPSVLWRVHPRLAVGLGVDLGVPLRRTRAEIENLEVLHTVGPVYARALLRMEVRVGARIGARVGARRP